jgi:AraC family transcriptional activator of tynA and feaB
VHDLLRHTKIAAISAPFDWLIVLTGNIAAEIDDRPEAAATGARVTGPSRLSVSTLGVSTSQRPVYWANALTALCGRLHADAYGAETIDGHIDYADIWRLRLCHIEASRNRVVLPAEWAEKGLHSVIKIHFQTDGTSIFEQDGRHITVSPGDCLAYDASRPHAITSAASTKHDVVIIPKELVAQRRMRLDRMPAQLRSAREGAAYLAHDLVLSTLKEAPALSPACMRRIADTLLELLLLPFVARNVSDGKRDHSSLLREVVKSYIEKHLRDPELSVDRVAANVGCTKRYLHKLFGVEGVTISQYIWNTRLENCWRELVSSPCRAKAITDVAYSWGFSSSSHFSRTFKRRYGVTPSALKAGTD